MPLQHVVAEQVLHIHKKVGVLFQLVVHKHAHKVLVRVRRQLGHDEGDHVFGGLATCQLHQLVQLGRLLAHRGVVADGGLRLLCPGGQKGCPCLVELPREGGVGLAHGGGGLGGGLDSYGGGVGDGRVGSDEVDVGVGLARGVFKDRGLPAGFAAGRADSGPGAGAAAGAVTMGESCGPIIACGTVVDTVAVTVARVVVEAGCVVGMAGRVYAVAPCEDGVVGVVAWEGVLVFSVAWKRWVYLWVAFPALVNVAVYDLGISCPPDAKVLRLR